MSLVTKECGRLSSLRRAESEQIAEPSIGIEAVTDILIQSTSIPIRETLVAPASPPTTPVRVASTSVVFVSYSLQNLKIFYRLLLNQHRRVGIPVLCQPP
ncbi:hypothetical protein Ciccas_012533 [Cichlidogyrus casuarinus]|uniref:Uncharacterized protein n=1 Tax=Cichlidogyrus casuarinus TaxID=1844966 RepID=A0ABD2PPH6_9PLAT